MPSAGSPPQGDRSPTPDRAAAWVSLRGLRVGVWGLGAALCGAGLALGVRLVQQVAERGVGALLADGEGLPGAAVALGVGLAALVALPVLLLRAPRYWTVQGVAVGADGIDIVARPLWWFGGAGRHLTWRDVLFVSPARHRRRNRVELAVHLERIDGAARLPEWAVFVPAGRWMGGQSADWPRVLLRMDTDRAERLSRALREARPDVFDDSAVHAQPTARVETAGEAGTAEVAGAPESHGTETHPPHRVDLRRDRASRWAVALLADLAVAAVLTRAAWQVGLVDQGTVGPGIIAAVPLLVVVVPATAWLVRVAPRVLTRQGIDIDTDGITLAQESALWFAGHRAHLPWSEIRLVTDAALSHDARARGGVVPFEISVFLHQPDRSTDVPTWAALIPREDTLAPATGAAPLTRVRLQLGPRRHVELLRAARAARPDLVE